MGSRFLSNMNNFQMTLAGTNTLDHRGTESNSNEGVLLPIQSSRTGASPSNAI